MSVLAALIETIVGGIALGEMRMSVSRLHIPALIKAIGTGCDSTVSREALRDNVQ